MNESKVCSLIFDADAYNPDTLDLHTDQEAREYWFKCIGDLVQKSIAVQAEHSQRDDPTAKERAQLYQNEFNNVLSTLSKTENRCKPLSIRTLLELNESCLRLYGFNDPWYEDKKLENIASISRFNSRLKELDKYTNQDDKWVELFRGLLAGNIFDRGAQAVTQILENDHSFGLHEALDRIESRPWLIDGLDDWLERLRQGSAHKCAAIFVDNSGVDIVLGVIPFARELLSRGTKVILCANVEPSLNDVTLSELQQVVAECCHQCDLIKEATETKRLLICGNGQIGPCLDMRRISTELMDAIEVNGADLLVIEGMGRALHTNLNAKFKCDTLKLAVVKNKWWANRLGGDNFSIICKYESK